jgi:hypothetical protein
LRRLASTVKWSGLQRRGVVGPLKGHQARAQVWLDHVIRVEQPTHR